ncbi:MAG: plastocyanin/azurin family copper-binding protein [Proteobacteria bacterium]|nr:plastocyanin/azurin family copper-binding protein [Pseudomonadota bacterium]
MEAWRAAALAVLLGVAACGTGADDSAVMMAPMGPAAVVEMNQAAFVPATVTVRVGDTVEWRNGTYNIHTVTTDPGMVRNRANVSVPGGAQVFNSGDLNRGQSYSRTFTVAGVYRYVSLSNENSGMAGTVIVTE